MHTVIGWDAEEALAERVVAIAHGHVPSESFGWISEWMDAGQFETAVREAVRSEAPITPEIAAEIRTAWIDEREPDDWPVGRAGLERTLTQAGYPRTVSWAGSKACSLVSSSNRATV